MSCVQPKSLRSRIKWWQIVFYESRRIHVDRVCCAGMSIYLKDPSEYAIARLCSIGGPYNAAFNKTTKNSRGGTPCDMPCNSLWCETPDTQCLVASPYTSFVSTDVTVRLAENFTNLARRTKLELLGIGNVLPWLVPTTRRRVICLQDVGENAGIFLHFFYFLL